jgi:hypothetical protein
MLAWIEGVMVQGSPDEIERFRMITAEKKISTNLKDVIETETNFFRHIENDVPEHVKNYDKYPYTYISSGRQTHRVWY